MLNPIFNIYKNKVKIRNFKKLKFKAFKKVMPLKVFKSHYIKDFYTNKELANLREVFNIDKVSLNMALMKRSILHRIVTRKYYAIFFPKEFPNRFPKRRRKYFRRKPKKKNLLLRLKFFYSIPQDNFLFYLTILDKRLLIKPFNFLNCLFFLKMRKFKKFFVVRKRRRLRFRFYYRFGRRKKRRRSVRRRRVKYLKYRFKKKFLMRRFKRIKIRKYKNFLRFIAFFNTCKKTTLKIDDYFKVNSLLNNHYKLLRFNFNKLTNSYNFFFNFNQQRKSSIYINTTTNVFKKKKKEVFKLITFKLKNRFILNSNNSEIFDFEKNQNINQKFQINDYLNYNNVIKDSIVKNYQINCSKTTGKNLYQTNQFFLILKLINKISKKILFFEHKIINFKLKEKKKLGLLFLKFFNLNNKKIVTIFKNYKQVLTILLDIILKLKNKLKELIISFYILYFNNNNNLNYIKKKKSKFFKKILYWFNRRKFKLKKKHNNLLQKFYKMNRNKFFCSKYSTFPFSYRTKLNKNKGKIKRWKLRKLLRSIRKRRKRACVKYIKKTFILKNFFLYKTNLSTTSYLGSKKCKSSFLNFIKNSNVKQLRALQTKKNINFLKEHGKY